jgi:hypothetical protein
LESYLPLITGSSGALVVLAIGLYLFLAGKIHSHSEYRKLEKAYEQLQAENNQQRYALETERKTANELTAAGQVTNQLITALTTLAGGRKPGPPGQLPAAGLQ